MTELVIASAVLAGGSSGGLVARRFAIDPRERTPGLVLLGSPLAPGDTQAARQQWDSTSSRLADPRDPALVRGFVEGMLVRPVPRAFRESVLEEALRVPGRVWKEAGSGFMEDNFQGQLRRIEAPALIVGGARDSSLPRGDQAGTAGRGTRRGAHALLGKAPAGRFGALGIRFPPEGAGNAQGPNGRCAAGTGRRVDQGGGKSI